MFLVEVGSSAMTPQAPAAYSSYEAMLREGQDNAKLGWNFALNVWIPVGNTGCGIPVTREKVFDAFLTTKGLSRTALGLW